MQPSDLRWSEQTYSIKDFHNKFGNQLPKFMMIICGFYGHTEMDTFPSDQVMYVKDIDVQKRVITRDYKGRCLSIPVEYPVKFEIIENGKVTGKTRYLKDIIAKCSLPCYIRFAKEAEGVSFTTDASSNALVFPELELIEVYDEKYLKAITVAGDVVFSRILVIPFFMNITVTVAEGLRDNDDDMWCHFQDAYAKAVEDINFDDNFGNPNIALYEDKTIQESSKTTNINNEGEAGSTLEEDAARWYLQAEPDAYVKLVKVPPKESKFDFSKLYEKVSSYYDAHYNSKTQPEPNREILVSLNSSPKPHHSESDPEYDIPLARYKDDTTEQDSSPAPPLPVRMPVTTVTTATSQTNPTYTDVESPSSHPTGLLSQLKKKLKSNMSLSGIRKEGKHKRPKLNLRSLSLDETSSANTSTARMRANTEGDDVEDDLNSDGDCYEDVDVEETQARPAKPSKAAPSPRKHDVPSNASAPPNVHGPIHNLAQVPEDIRGLSVVQICQCLSLLKLERYIQGFKDNDIDGSLLCTLNAEDLETNLQFNSLHSKKLFHFVGGWRPKTQ